MSNLVYLDTETTGLDPELHEIWEIAYAVNDGPVVSYNVPHSLLRADPKALVLNGYFNRVGVGIGVDVDDRIDLSIRMILEDSTLVCANPTFDRMMMRKRWGLEPYHYRSIDIESMALVVFDWDRPRGLKDIRAELVSHGFDIPEPDHSAAMDVKVTRACYKALREQNQKWKIY